MSIMRQEKKTAHQDREDNDDYEAERTRVHWHRKNKDVLRQKWLYIYFLRKSCSVIYTGTEWSGLHEGTLSERVLMCVCECVKVYSLCDSLWRNERRNPTYQEV